MEEPRRRNVPPEPDIRREEEIGVYPDRGAEAQDVKGYYTSHEPSLGELITDLTREFSTLVSEEIRLAQVEMTNKAKQAGKDLGFAIAGGFIAYGGFLFLLLAAVIGLSYFMWDWLAALIVGLVVVAIGGFLARKGIKDLTQIDPVPKQTVETLQEDKEFLQRQVK